MIKKLMMLCVAAMAAIGAWAATWTDLKTGYTWTGIKIRFSYGRVTLIGRRRISEPRSLDRGGPVPNAANLRTGQLHETTLEV